MTEDVRVATAKVYDSTTGTLYTPGEPVVMTEELAQVKQRGNRKVVPGFDERSAVTTETRVAGDKKSAVEAAAKGKGKPKPKKSVAKQQAADEAEDKTAVEEGGPSRAKADDKDDEKANPLS